MLFIVDVMTSPEGRETGTGLFAVFPINIVPSAETVCMGLNKSPHDQIEKAMRASKRKIVNLFCADFMASP